VRQRVMARAFSGLAPGERERVVERLARRELDPFTAADEIVGRMARA
jgi:hypothetical protein